MIYTAFNMTKRKYSLLGTGTVVVLHKYDYY